MHLPSYALLALILLGTMTPTGKLKASTVEELAEQAMDKFQADQVDQGFSLLAKALELDPAHEDVLYRLCLLNIRYERFAEAQPHCHTLVDQHPDNESYRLNLFWSRASTNIGLAQTSLERGDFDGAIQAAKRVVEADPDIPQAQLLVGNVYVMANRARNDRLRAVAHLREAISLHERLVDGSQHALSPQDLAMVYTGLGVTYHREEDPERSVVSFEKALALDPNIPDGRNNLELARKLQSEGNKSNIRWLSLADILGIE